MFKPTDKTKITRLANRGSYDSGVIYPILDEALFCTVSYCKADQPFSIPNAFCRVKNTLYLHGSVKSHFVRELAKEIPLCISVTLIDGLVLARSVFHHSINYRSVVLFGKGRLVKDDRERQDAMNVFTEKMIPGRWDDARQPNEGELAATAIIAVEIQEASAKLRTGPASDDKRDMDLPVWAGVLPLSLEYGEPERNPDLKEEIELPAYLK